MQTSVVSFGFKHGVPLDVDLMFDCRFLPNPVLGRVACGATAASSPRSGTTCSTGPRPPRSSTSSTTSWPCSSPPTSEEGKSYLTVAMGCTGGRHRSVVLAEELSRRLDAHGLPTTVFHRDVDR